MGVTIPRVLSAATLGLVAALTLASPAWAHGGDAPDGTNYRTEVTGMSGALPGVSVRAVEAGARLELTNDGDETVEVLGYDGEPYLEVRPDGVFENVKSPATYLNETLQGGEVPPTADPTAPPQWRQVDDEPVARWHDHRSHWMSATPPPQVAAEPDKTHRIRDWVVPLRSGVITAEAHGTLDWIPPPTAGAWWAASVLCATAIGLLGLVSVGGRGGRAASAALAVLAVVGGLTGIGYAVARELDAGANGAGEILLGLLAGQVWPVLAGLGAVAAGVYALARRPSADFGMALAGACLALFAGVANSAVFGRGVAPVPFSPTLARVAVLLLIAIGAGLAAAGSLRLRAAVSAAQPAPPAEPTPPAAPAA
jgi:hypothetical protein